MSMASEGLTPVLAVQEVEASGLGAAVAASLGRGARYLTMAASDHREDEGRLRVDVVLAPGGPGPLEVLRLHLPPQRAEYASLTPILPAVHWDEREARDLLGVVPLGHPDPRPLVLPDDWPRGLHPLRRDVPWDVHPASAVGAAWSARLAEGEGVVHMPVGPVHAGIIDSGHFAFSLMGESILHLDVRLGWKHRGVEKTVEGTPWEEASAAVERVCATCSASQQAAWSEAVEQILGWPLPPRAVWLRTILLECERLANHINDIAALPAGTGYTVAAMAGSVLKERMLRLAAQAFGHRYLFGAIRPGGVARDLDPAAGTGLRQGLGELRGDLERLTQRMLRHPGFVDRIHGTGVLRPSTARDLGGVGPVARASGVRQDLRLDRPYLAYRQLAPLLVVEEEGDVAARLRVRIREAAVSLELLDRLLHGLPPGPWRAPAPAGAERASGLGIGACESPRGAQVHYLELRQGRIFRLRIRSSSFANWPLLLEAVPGNLIGDFPLINKSFELCYACSDR